MSLRPRRIRPLLWAGWLAISLITVLPTAAPRGVEPAEPTRLTFDGWEKQRPVWSPDGQRLMVARHEPGGSKIYLFLLDPASPRNWMRLTRREPPEYHGVFAPDGKSVLFASISQSGTQGNLDLAVIPFPSEGQEPKVIVSDSGKLAHQDWPSWSPDGRRFAFSSTHEGNQEIYVADADGSRLVRLTRSPGYDAHPCWAPDNRIVFTTDRFSGLELAETTPEGSEVRRLTRSAGFDDFAAVAPDGRRIAFVTNRDGNFEIGLIDRDGGSYTNLSHHPTRDTFPTWRPDGRSVTFVSDRSGQPELHEITVEP